MNMKNGAYFLTGIGMAIGLCFLSVFLVSARQSSYQEIHKEWFRIQEQDVVCLETCVSRIMTTRNSFSFADIEWDSQYTFQVRFLEHGTWTEWTDIKGELDTPDSAEHKPSSVFSLYQGHAFQLSSQHKEGFASLVVVVFSLPPTQKIQSSDFTLAAEQSSITASLPVLSLISRSEWLDDKIELTSTERERKWPSQYDGIKKFIIHHTATNNRDITHDGVIDKQDYRELIRAIYVSHASNRGWGDIGYQYIIDPQGTIWEGRYGGDGSIGGHAYRDKKCTKFGAGDVGFNRGTIGISLLGTFSSEDITPEARESLVKLITRKAWEFGIAPNGMSEYAGTMYANVIGHRDVDCTDCPGEKIYSNISSISFDAQKRYEELKVTVPRIVRAEFFDSSASAFELQNGEAKYLTLRFKNTGTVAWRGYGDQAVRIALADIKTHLASLETFTLSTESKEENGKNENSEIFQNSSSFLATLKQSNVYPGEVGEFSVPITHISPELKSEQKFVMVLGDQGWFPYTDFAVAITNIGLEYAATLESSKDLYSIFDSPGQEVIFQFRNNGTQEWKQEDIALHIASLDEALSPLEDPSWKKNKQQFLFQEQSVKPGELATFSLNVHGKELGELGQYIALYHGEEKVSGSDYESVKFTVKPTYAVRIVEHTLPEIIKNPSALKVSVTLENIGGKKLDKMMLMGYGVDSKKQTVLQGKGWLSKTVIGKIPNINIGQARRIDFTISSPMKSGTYPLTLALVQEKKYVKIEQDDGLYMKDQVFEIQVEEKPKPKVTKKKINLKKKK